MGKIEKRMGKSRRKNRENWEGKLGKIGKMRGNGNKIEKKMGEKGN